MSRALPRVWQGIEYRRLDDPGPARELFAFAAEAWPPEPRSVTGLGAWADGRTLVGAVLIEPEGPAALLHGPVVHLGERSPGADGESPRPAAPHAGRAPDPRAAVAPEVSPAPIAAPPGTPRDRSAGAASDALEVAAQLASAAVDHVAGSGVETVFTRPRGLDRIWVRLGFIPVPEGALPRGLRGRPGAGLFAYRGGSALWSLRPSPPDTVDRARSPERPGGVVSRDVDRPGPS